MRIILTCALLMFSAFAEATICTNDNSPQEFIEWNSDLSFVRHYVLDNTGKEFWSEVLHDANHVGGVELFPPGDKCEQTVSDSKTTLTYMTSCQLDIDSHGYESMTVDFKYDKNLKKGSYVSDRYLGSGSANFGFSFSNCK